jgi:hypothetical protein
MLQNIKAERKRNGLRKRVQEAWKKEKRVYVKERETGRKGEEALQDIWESFRFFTFPIPDSREISSYFPSNLPNLHSAQYEMPKSES